MNMVDLYEISIDELKKHLLERLFKLAEHTIADLIEKGVITFDEIDRKINTIDDIVEDDVKILKKDQILQLERNYYTTDAYNLKRTLDKMILLERVRDHPETLSDEQRRRFGVK